MKEFKQIVGFLFSLLAGILGYQSNPEVVLTFGALIGATYTLTQLFKNYVSHPKWIQVVSWLTGLLIAGAGWWLQLGIFVEVPWYAALVTGFLASLASNGVYDSEWVQTAWKIFMDLLKPKPTPVED